MPELPEVEFARRHLLDWTQSTRITRVETTDGKGFSGDSNRLNSASFSQWNRQGKYLIGLLDNSWEFISHLGMTGKWVKNPTQDRKHIRVSIHLENGDKIAFIDPRRFGHCWLTQNSQQHERLKRLGPDAYDPKMTQQLFYDRCHPSTAPLKQRLLNQSVVAGLGNIATIEIAWRAKLHPHTRCNELTQQQWHTVYDKMLEHLNYILDTEDGEEITYLVESNSENPFLCYARGGEPCSRCNTAIGRVVLSGRPTYYCATCQPELKAR